MPKKLKIAITGGIGAGKSEVSRIISESGFKVINADQVAKEILSNDSVVKEMIIAEFGKESYTGNEPNKIYLAENVFSDSHNVEKINSIIHPRTIKRIFEYAEEALLKYHLVFVESALIFEAKREELFDYIIHVNSSMEHRLERSIESKNISKFEVEMRMSHQIDEEIKKKKSDFIIENNSTLKDLEQKTKFVLTLLESISKG
jgi:dephospho-CoA kinase